MPAIGVAAKVPDEPSVVFVREASLRFDDAMGVVFNQGPVAARIDLEDATVSGFIPATVEGLCQRLRAEDVGEFAGQEGSCALHAPGELRVQDVNAPVSYADPDPPAAEAAGVGLFGVDAAPVDYRLLKFEVVTDLFRGSPEGGQVAAQLSPEGLVAQALIRQDQISRRTVIGCASRQRRVPRRCWARGGSQGRGDGSGGHLPVERSGGRGKLRLRSRLRSRLRGRWRPSWWTALIRVEKLLKPMFVCVISQFKFKPGVSPLRTLLPRRRGREQENRHGQNSATGAIFRVNIH